MHMHSYNLCIKYTCTKHNDFYINPIVLSIPICSCSSQLSSHYSSPGLSCPSGKPLFSKGTYDVLL